MTNAVLYQAQQQSLQHSLDILLLPLVKISDYQELIRLIHLFTRCLFVCGNLTPLGNYAENFAMFLQRLI